MDGLSGAPDDSQAWFRCEDARKARGSLLAETGRVDVPAMFANARAARRQPKTDTLEEQRGTQVDRLDQRLTGAIVGLRQEIGKLDRRLAVRLGALLSRMAWPVICQPPCEAS